MAGKKFDLQKYKATIKEAEVPLKEDTVIDFDPALQEVSGLQGLPMGHVLQIYGPSNGGKSTLANHLAAKAQAKGILPIFIITEGKIQMDRLEKMGLKTDEAIVVYATYLEEIFQNIDKYMIDQAIGDLPMDILFIVDSIGNTLSRESVEIAKDGTTEFKGAMMKAAKVIRENMRVFSHRINDTRKVNSPHSTGLIFVNHSYKSPPSFPGGPTTDTPYGGDGIYYASSLVIKVRKTKQLVATKDGKDVSFGIVSKIAVEKNHINGVSNSGSFVIVPQGLLPNEAGALKDYKESLKGDFGTFKTEDGASLEDDET